jgi:hypothetical protein
MGPNLMLKIENPTLGIENAILKIQNVMLWALNSRV